MDNYAQQILKRTYEDVCEWGVVLYDQKRTADEHSERILLVDYFSMVYCCIVIDGEVEVCEYVSDNKELIQKMTMFMEVKE